MLPDFKKTKRLIEQRTSNVLDVRTQFHMGGFGSIARRKVHEGSGFITDYGDGMKDDSELQQMPSKAEIDIRKLLQDPAGVYIEVLEKIAFDQAFQQSKLIIDKVTDVTEKTGNVYDFRGEFTADKLIELLSRYEMDFMPNGQPRLPTMFTGKASIENVKKAFAQINESPELAKKLEKVIIEQRQRWYDRAAARKLVD